MRRWLAICGAIAVAACSSSTAVVKPSPSPPPSVNWSPSAEAVVMVGGCGTTHVYKGGEPGGLSDAVAGLRGLADLPYFITNPPIAAGFLFSYPLRAGPYQQPGNKILWVVGIPRNEDLKVTGHPLGAATPSVQYSFPPNSSPGEIYPSETDAPTAGCWHFDLSWGKNKTAVDLVYV